MSATILWEQVIDKPAQAIGSARPSGFWDILCNGSGSYGTEIYLDLNDLQWLIPFSRIDNSEDLEELIKILQVNKNIKLTKGY